MSLRNLQKNISSRFSISSSLLKTGFCPNRKLVASIGVELCMGTMIKTEMQKTPREVGMLVIYDNVEAGKMAKALCDRIEQFLGPEYELHLRLWNMAAWANPVVNAGGGGSNRMAKRRDHCCQWQQTIAAIFQELAEPVRAQAKPRHWCHRRPDLRGSANKTEAHSCVYGSKTNRPRRPELLCFLKGWK